MPISQQITYTKYTSPSGKPYWTAEPATASHDHSITMVQVPNVGLFFAKDYEDDDKLIVNTTVKILRTQEWVQLDGQQRGTQTLKRFIETSTKVKGGDDELL